MTLIKNISGLGDLFVPDLGKVVTFGETVDVPDSMLEAFVCQTENWQAVAYAPPSKQPQETPANADQSAAPETNEETK